MDSLSSQTLFSHTQIFLMNPLSRKTTKAQVKTAPQELLTSRIYQAFHNLSYSRHTPASHKTQQITSILLKITS